jgi:hypothetical protein
MVSAAVFSKTEIDLNNDSAIWASLKLAIATSSGFKCWQEEQTSEKDLTVPFSDTQIRHYLRQTLETLAY